MEDSESLTDINKKLYNTIQFAYSDSDEDDLINEKKENLKNFIPLLIKKISIKTIKNLHLFDVFCLYFLSEINRLFKTELNKKYVIEINEYEYPTIKIIIKDTKKLTLAKKIDLDKKESTLNFKDENILLNHILKIKYDYHNFNVNPNLSWIDDSSIKKNESIKINPVLSEIIFTDNNKIANLISLFEEKYIKPNTTFIKKITNYIKNIPTSFNQMSRRKKILFTLVGGTLIRYGIKKLLKKKH